MSNLLSTYCIANLNSCKKSKKEQHFKEHLDTRFKSTQLNTNSGYLF